MYGNAPLGVEAYNAIATVYDAGSPPAGTFTVGAITTTQTTASAPYTYSAADFDSIEYRIDGGAAVTASASPQSLSSLTADTTYGIEFRAVNAFGSGAWSAVANFTTDAGGDTTPPTFTVAPAVTSISTTTATVTATINETGNIYHVIVPQADATPSVAQVKAGQNSAGGAPVDSGSALATTTISDPVSGLTAGTAYKMCMVAEDDESPPNIQAAVTTVNFTTFVVGFSASATVSTTFANFSASVAASYIEPAPSGDSTASVNVTFGNFTASVAASFNAPDSSASVSATFANFSAFVIAGPKNLGGVASVSASFAGFSASASVSHDSKILPGDIGTMPWQLAIANKRFIN